MTIVVYQGSNYGNQTYYGPITGTRYTFSRSKPRKYVDKKDLRADVAGRKVGLLDLLDRGSPLFKTEETKTAQIKSSVEPQKEEPAQELVQEVKRDEFTQLSGVGVSTAQKLYDAGFSTFSSLLVATADEIVARSGLAKSKVVSIQTAIKSLQNV